MAVLGLGALAPLGCEQSEFVGAGGGASAADGGAGGGAGAGSVGGPGPVEFDSEVVGSALAALNCDFTDSADLTVPEGGEELASSASLDTYVADGVNVMIEDVAVEGQTFATAKRATSDGTTDDAWSAQLIAANTSAVADGDVLLAEFYVRCEKSIEESGECRTEFTFELGRDPWTKSVTFPATATHQYQRFLVPFTADGAYEAGDANVSLRLGYANQTIDIGGFRLVNFGAARSVDDLPKSAITYKGMEEGAAWRQAAEERIEAQRKSTLTVEVVDKDGAPVSDATVSVKLTNHEFDFGTAISARFLEDNQTGADADLYRAHMRGLFNTVTLENAFKWPALAGDWGANWDLDLALDTVDIASDSGLRTRGHVLVWPSFRNMPKSMAALEGDPDALRAAVNGHIDELVTAAKGKLHHWDVLNEPFDNHDLMDILGEAEMKTWFERARGLDADTPLFINDYAILSGGDGETAHRSHYESVIESLTDDGAPLDGIGMQGHFGGSLTSPEYVLGLLDRFGRFKKDIVVTEYDIDVDDQRLAACYTRDFLTAIFSHESATGFVMWGFWDGAHWKENAPVFDKDWNMKFQGAVYRDLVQGRWATSESTQTDSSGRVSVKGYRGRYEVEVTLGDRTTSQTVTLTRAGETLKVELL